MEGYAQLCERVGRPLTPVTRSLVERGTAAITQTRLEVPLRANVWPDIQATGDEGQHRISAAEEAWSAPCEGSGEAAHAIVTGAATCGAFSELVVRNMGEFMLPGEDVRIVSAEIPTRKSEEGEDSRHAFVIARRSGPEGENSKREVVLDAWANGPAVRLADSAYKGLTLTDEYALPWTKDEAKALDSEARASVDRMKSNHEKLNTWEEAVLELRESTANHPQTLPLQNDEDVWPESHVLSNEFLQQASYPLRKD